MDIQDILLRSGHLPASLIAHTVNQSLDTHNTLVITAPPGAGKSTLLPLTIQQALDQGRGKLLMLEPRRIAARQHGRRTGGPDHWLPGTV